MLPIYNASPYADFADMAATQYGIPTDIFRNLVGKESAWNPSAVGSSGEIGLTQIMPLTAIQYGYSPAALQENPQLQLMAGADILSRLKSKFDSWADALAAYNAGPGNYKSKAGQKYAADILNAGGSNKGQWYAKGVLDGRYTPSIADAWNARNGDLTEEELNSFSWLDPKTWVPGVKKALKGYKAPIGLAILALLLIAAGAWKSIK
jgi:hypothetical protein